MGKKPNDQPAYPFNWLEEIVELIVTQETPALSGYTNGELAAIKAKTVSEAHKIYASLKARMFCLFSLKKRKAIVSQYLATTGIIIDRLRSVQRPDPALQQLIGELIVIIDGLKADVEMRFNDSLPEKVSSGTDTHNKQQQVKILCSLTVDQLGIILKAAEDSKVIIAGSTSLMFRTLVPFLSTVGKKDISWDSMRSNAYRPEDNDKRTALKALEQMILKIKDY